MKQSAVEWIHELSKQREPDKFDWQRAKEMEKQQIIDAYCHNDIDDVIMQDFAKEYYNETYKQD